MLEILPRKIMTLRVSKRAVTFISSKQFANVDMWREEKKNVLIKTKLLLSPGLN